MLGQALLLCTANSSEPVRSALITGVSSGIGQALAKHLLDDGWLVFGSVRDHSDAAPLMQHAPERYIPLRFDVRDYDAIEASAEVVRTHLGEKNLDLLVNNAGIAVYGPLMHIPLEEVERQFQVNVFGVVKVTQIFLPLLGARPGHSGTSGRIINISSVSGLVAFPFLGPYAASKHALEALSDSLRRELLLYPIPVTIIEPASVRSAIWQKVRDASLYMDGTDYAALTPVRNKIIDGIEAAAMDTDRICRLVLRIANGRARRTRYLITPRNLWYRLMLYAPDRWIDALVKRRLRRWWR